MMVQCPKCGFNQPDDKYCPQCGVDIERYQPKKLSFGAQVLASSSFYIFLAIVIAIATGYLIATELKNHRAQQDARMASTQERLLSKPTSGTVATVVSSDAVASEGAAQANSAASASGVATSSAVGVAEQKATAGNLINASTTSTTLLSQQRGISKLRLYYVEGLIEFFPGGSGYADRETVLDTRGQPLDSKARVLNESIVNDLTLNHQSDDQQITEDPKLDRAARGIGVVTRITVRSNDVKSTKLDVNISARYPDTMNPDRTVAVRSNSPPQFQVDLVSSRVFYIGGLVPHRLYGEGEEVLRELVNGNSILRVMLSPTFSSPRFATDFILLIAPGSDSLND